MKPNGFTPTSTAVFAQEDEQSEPRLDGVGKTFNFVTRDEPVVNRFLPGEFDSSSRVPTDASSLDREIENLGQDLMSFVDRGWGQPLSNQALDPILNVIEAGLVEGDATTL